jgi:hypothetical protein
MNDLMYDIRKRLKQAFYNITSDGLLYCIQQSARKLCCLYYIYMMYTGVYVCMNTCTVRNWFLTLVSSLRLALVNLRRFKEDML